MAQMHVYLAWTSKEMHMKSDLLGLIRSAKQDDVYGASNIVLPCPSSKVIFHLVEDVVIILKSSV
jgi:hypothetical protein